MEGDNGLGSGRGCGLPPPTTPRRRLDALVRSLRTDSDDGCSSSGGIDGSSSRPVISSYHHNGRRTAQSVKALMSDLTALIPQLEYGEEGALIPPLLRMHDSSFSGLPSSVGSDSATRDGDTPTAATIAAATTTSTSLIGLLTTLHCHSNVMPWAVRFRLCVRTLAWRRRQRRGNTGLLTSQREQRTAMGQSRSSSAGRKAGGRKRPRSATMMAGSGSSAARGHGDEYGGSERILQVEEVGEDEEEVQTALANLLDGICAELRSCASRARIRGAPAAAPVTTTDGDSNHQSLAGTPTGWIANDLMLRRWHDLVGNERTEGSARFGVRADLTSIGTAADGALGCCWDAGAVGATSGTEAEASTAQSLPRLPSAPFSSSSSSQPPPKLVSNENMDRLRDIIGLIDGVMLADVHVHVHVGLDEGEERFASSSSSLGTPLPIVLGCRGKMGPLDVWRKRKAELGEEGPAPSSPPLTGNDEGDARKFIDNITAGDEDVTRTPANSSAEKATDCAADAQAQGGDDAGNANGLDGDELLTDARRAALLYGTSIEARVEIRLRIRRIMELEDDDGEGANNDRTTPRKHGCGTLKSERGGGGKEYLSELLFALLFATPSPPPTTSGASSKDGRPELIATQADQQQRLRRGTALLVSYLLHQRVPGHDIVVVAAKADGSSSSMLVPSPVAGFLGVEKSGVGKTAEEATDSGSSSLLLCALTGGGGGDDRRDASQFEHCDFLPSLQQEGGVGGWKNLRTPHVGRPGAAASGNTQYISRGEGISELGLEVCVGNFLRSGRRLYQERNGLGNPAAPLSSRDRPAIFRGYGPVPSPNGECLDNNMSVPDVRGLVLDLFDLVLGLSASSVTECGTRYALNDETPAASSAASVLRIVTKFAEWLPPEPVISRYRDLLSCAFGLHDGGEDSRRGDDIRQAADENEEGASWFRAVSSLLVPLSLETVGRVIMHATSFVQLLQQACISSDPASRAADSVHMDMMNVWAQIFNKEFCLRVLLPLSFRSDLTSIAGACLRHAAAAKSIILSVLSYVRQSLTRSLDECINLGWAIHRLADFQGTSHNSEARIRDQYYRVTQRMRLFYLSTWGYRAAEEVGATEQLYNDTPRLFCRDCDLSPLGSLASRFSGQVDPCSGCNSIAILMPEFDDFSDALIKFALQSSVPKEAAEPWCRYIANVVVQRLVRADKKPLSLTPFMNQWARRLVIQLVRRSKPAPKHIHFSPLLKGVHAAVIMSLAGRDLGAFQRINDDSSYTQSSPISAPKDQFGFASVLVDLYEETDAVTTEKANKDLAKADLFVSEDHLVTVRCIKDILCSTPPIALFSASASTNGKFTSQSTCPHLVKKVLSYFGHDSAEMASLIMIGLGLCFEHRTSRSTPNKVTKDVAAAERGCKSDEVSKVVLEFLTRGGVNSWPREGESIPTTSERFEHFSVTVRAELESHGARVGVDWWQNLVLEALTTSIAPGDKSTMDGMLNGPIKTGGLIQQMTAHRRMLEDDLCLLGTSLPPRMPATGQPPTGASTAGNANAKQPPPPQYRSNPSLPLVGSDASSIGNAGDSRSCPPPNKCDVLASRSKRRLSEISAKAVLHEVLRAKTSNITERRAGADVDDTDNDPLALSGAASSPPGGKVNQQEEEPSSVTPEDDDDDEEEHFDDDDDVLLMDF